MWKPQSSNTRQELEQLLENSGKIPEKIPSKILNPALPEWFSTGTDVGPEVGEWSWGMESLECSPGNGCEGPRGTNGTRGTGMCWDESMRNFGMHWEREDYWDTLGTSGSLGRALGIL